MVKLEIAKCCGSCKHINKPKEPEDHAAHYTVAKTERWCHKFGIPTMREAYCKEGYELASGRCAAKTNLGRIQKQNERLQRVINVSTWMKDNKIDKIPYFSRYSSYGDNEPYAWYVIVDGKVMRQSRYHWDKPEHLRIKDESAVAELEQAVEDYKKTIGA